MSAFAAALIVLVGWGAFAFGGITWWAYTPLLTAAAALGAWAWASATASEKGRDFADGPLLCALGGVIAAVLMQLVPLPATWRDAISPAAVLVEAQVFEGAGAERIDGEQWRAPVPVERRFAALSIDPDRTSKGLAFVAAFSLLFAGASRRLTPRDIQGLMAGLVVLGVVLASTGMHFRPMVPRFVEELSDGADMMSVAEEGPPEAASADDTFGPFGNRNHFAGWMLMAIPAGIGFVLALADRRMRAAASGRAAAAVNMPCIRPAIFASGIVLMGLSVFRTQSRSGIAGLLVALVLMGIVVLRARAGASARLATAYAGSVVLLVALSAACGDLGTALGRYAQVNDRDLAGRIPIWHDAVRVVREFPVAGTGLNTYERAAAWYRTTGYRAQAAHNDYLELAADGGLLLGVPALLLAAAFVATVRRRYREDAVSSSGTWLRSGAVAGLIAIAVQETFEFSLQMPGNTTLFVVLCAVAAHRAPPASLDAASVARGREPRGME